VWADRATCVSSEAGVVMGVGRQTPTVSCFRDEEHNKRDEEGVPPSSSCLARRTDVTMRCGNLLVTSKPV